MEPHDARPIERLTFDAQWLMAEHPPVLRHPNKQIVFDVACPSGAAHSGRIDYSRWAAMPLPAAVDAKAAVPRVAGRVGFYDYATEVDLPDAIEWHVNFADPALFAFYGTALFAQDEMQVASHPAPGALREALIATSRPAVTVEHGRPTPVLVMGVERRCTVATDPNAAEGRPAGLYGNRFAYADPDAIRRATSPVEPPTVSHIVAIAAPGGGHGRYTTGEIEHILTTAFTGFRAATLESARRFGAERPVVVHTGFWGCGAFGGNRTMMAATQALAAEMAGLARLTFHTGHDDGDEALAATLRLIGGQLAGDTALHPAELVARLAAVGLEWGVGDGN